MDSLDIWNHKTTDPPDPIWNFTLPDNGTIAWSNGSGLGGCDGIASQNTCYNYGLYCCTQNEIYFCCQDPSLSVVAQVGSKLVFYLMLVFGALIITLIIKCVMCCMVGPCCKSRRIGRCCGVEEDSNGCDQSCCCWPNKKSKKKEDAKCLHKDSGVNVVVNVQPFGNGSIPLQLETGSKDLAATTTNTSNEGTQQQVGLSGLMNKIKGSSSQKDVKEDPSSNEDLIKVIDSSVIKLGEILSDKLSTELNAIKKNQDKEECECPRCNRGRAQAHDTNIAIIA